MATATTILGTTGSTTKLDGLVHGDCINVLRTASAASVDLIITDPPYIARYRSRDGREIRNDASAEWLVPAFREAYRVLRPGRFMVCFYGWPKAELFLAAWRTVGFRPVGHLVGVKPYASSRRFVAYHHEQAYLLVKGTPITPARQIADVLPWTYSGNRWHPTEKPLSALRPLVEAFSWPGERVLDPFAGSGSTLVAARQLDRRACGIELDATYYSLACKRLGSTTTPSGRCPISSRLASRRSQ